MPTPERLIEIALEKGWKFIREHYWCEGGGCPIALLAIILGKSPAALEVEYPGVSAGFDGWLGTSPNYKYGQRVYQLAVENGLV